MLHPAATYFYDKALYAFDCLIVVTADRFVEVFSFFQITKREGEEGMRYRGGKGRGEKERDTPE